MKVIISGSREFNDYDLLKKWVDHMLSKLYDIEIVSGVTNGADNLGERYAMANGYPITQFNPDKSNGKGYVFIRNEKMAEYADFAIIFWDGWSQNTQHLIKMCEKHSVKFHVVKYKQLTKQ